MDTPDFAEAQVLLLARAMFAIDHGQPLAGWIPPTYVWSNAHVLLCALDREGGEVRPKSLGADMIASEQGCNFEGID